MNKKRRQKLHIALTELENVGNILGDVCDEENDALSNMPENLENSDRYMDMETNIECLYDAMSGINDAIESIEKIV